MGRAAKHSEAFQAALLAWYQVAQRPLPWRETTDPYRIWLAEVMLQQTTVAAVIPYYTRFLHRFPTVQSLAEAPIDEVLHLWQGLGYYRRAHLLHRCAQHVWQNLKGHFPTTEAGLLALPGFGPYTAAVVAACAYNAPAVVIDGNVRRVVARLQALDVPLTPTSKPLRTAAAALCTGAPPRLYANAIMELGATVCSPQRPACANCPVQKWCAAAQQGNPTAYPVALPKKTVPEKQGVAYVLRDRNGNIYLRQRPTQGLLGGLWEVPHTHWEESTPPPPLPDALHEAGVIRHVFTHLKLELDVRVGEVESIPTAHRFAPHQLPPLSTLMRKVLKVALTSQD